MTGSFHQTAGKLASQTYLSIPHLNETLETLIYPNQKFLQIVNCIIHGEGRVIRKYVHVGIIFSRDLIVRGFMLPIS